MAKQRRSEIVEATSVLINTAVPDFLDTEIVRQPKMTERDKKTTRIFETTDDTRTERNRWAYQRAVHYHRATRDHQDR